MYRIIVLDDEPNLVEGLCDSLERELGGNIEVFKAYSGQELCSLLTSMPVDLLISDIRMPGVNGLQLLESVEQLCPHCRVIFLTGYDRFDWAQAALRHPCCVDYLLKQQDDSVIIASVKQQLEHIALENEPSMLMRRITAQMEALQPLLRQQALAHWLEGGQPPSAEYSSLNYAEPVLFCLCRREQHGSLQSMFPNVLEQLLRENMSVFECSEVIPVGWSEIVWLAQRGNNPAQVDSIVHFVHTRLESVQSHMADLGESVDFAFDAHWIPHDASTVLARLREMLQQYAVSGRNVVLEESLVNRSEDSNENDIMQWIEKFIRDNIADANLSLTTIASKTYYAPAYLSRLFKQRSGQTLSSYIARQRIDTACQLLQAGNMNARQVGKAVGFESPSYFGVFFKRYTGLSPAQYMHDPSRRE